MREVVLSTVRVVRIVGVVLQVQMGGGSVRMLQLVALGRRKQNTAGERQRRGLVYDLFFLLPVFLLLLAICMLPIATRLSSTVRLAETGIKYYIRYKLYAVPTILQFFKIVPGKILKFT